MGTVFRASRADCAYNKDVAIKVIHRHLATAPMVVRFVQERQALASLEHPSITRLIDGGTTDDGLPYFVMEFVEGKRLDHYCDSRCLSIADRLRLMQRICEAVHYAHRNLIIHRDLKPSNILVALDGTPKLLDFGIAKLLTRGSPAAGAEATLTFV